MNQIKAASKYLLAIFMIVAGTMHVATPAFFLKIMPPYLPFHRELVLASGVFEVLFGILLLVPQSSRLAAWGIVALLLAVFPANLYLYQHQDILPASSTIRSQSMNVSKRFRKMRGSFRNPDATELRIWIGVADDFDDALTSLWD